MKRYPYTFIQADFRSLNLDLNTFDAIHASPPCQAHSSLQHLWLHEHPDLLPETLELLSGFDGPWVVENVPGADLPNPVVACGAALGCHVETPHRYTLKRHRVFSSNIPLELPPCNCQAMKEAGYQVLTVVGQGCNQNGKYHKRPGDSVKLRRQLMGIPHASSDLLSQAIPPAYTRTIGFQVMRSLVQTFQPA